MKFNAFDEKICEGLLKVYNLLSKKCKLLDTSIFHLGVTPTFDNREFSGMEIYNKMEEKINEKIDYINLKVMLDRAIEHLDINEKKMLLLKIFFKIDLNYIGLVLGKSVRTVFRYLEKAYKHLSIELNNASYKKNVIKIINQYSWINYTITNSIDRRLSYLKRSVDD